MEWPTVHVLAVIFLATVIRSGFGFGEALVAVPLLAIVMPVEVAAPLAALVSITVAGIVLAQDWQQVHVRSALGLVLSTFFGIPLGLLLLTMVEEVLVKAILAVFIIGFSLYCLTGRSKLELRDDRLAWVFGFGAGVLGGAYGMNGPPLVIYGSLRRWSPEHFRATLQGYFLPASALGLCGYWLADLWVWDVTYYFLVSLPVALAAIGLGRWINRRMKAHAFIVYVHVGLIVVGCVLLLQSIGKHCESGGLPMSIELTSTAFQHGMSIPKENTGDGADRSPPLRWSDPPSGTRSTALICDDPDAPRGTWVHWVLFNIPADTRELQEGVPTTATLASGAKQGRNDFGALGYGGPAPPKGKAHRYFFKLYALDVVLDIPTGSTKAELENAMKGHILAEGQLMGNYKR